MCGGAAKSLLQGPRRAPTLGSVQACAGLVRGVAIAAVIAAATRVAAAEPARPISAPRAPAATVSSGAGAPPSAAMRRLRAGGCSPGDVDAVIAEAADLYRAGLAKMALATMGQAVGCRRDQRTVRLAALYACAAQDAAVARLFHSMLAAQHRPAVVQRCQQENIALPGPVIAAAGAAIAAGSPQVAIAAVSGVACAADRVDELMYDAADRFVAGDAETALALTVDALACKQDTRMLRMAVVYACVAHDESAQRYYDQLPVQFRAAVRQRCLQDNMRLIDPQRGAAGGR